MCKTDFEKQIEKWGRAKLDTPAQKYPAWMISDIRQFAEKHGHTTKESLLIIQAKKGVPLRDLKIILDGEIKSE